MIQTLVITGLFLTAVATSFQIKQIDGITGRVKSMHFDSNFNCFVVANVNETDHLSKVDTDNKIVFIKNLNKIKKILVNGHDNVYIFDEIESTTTTDKQKSKLGQRWYSQYSLQTYKDEDYEMVKDVSTEYHNSIWTVKSNSKKPNKLFQWDSNNSKDFKQFMDKEGNLFFSTDKGIWFLKSDKNVPLPITDLTGHKLHFFAIDGNGDIYLKTEKTSELGENIQLIKQKTKNQPLLSVEMISDVVPDTSTRIDSIGTDQDGDVYFATRRETPIQVANITKRVHYFFGEVRLLLLQYDTFYSFLFATRDRFYFTRDIANKYFNIYFITKDDSVVAIEEMFEYPKITNDEQLSANDSLGNVYFAHEKTIILIKHNETEATKITTPTNFKISSVAVDKNDDLWVSAGKLYYFKNGTSNAIWVADLPGKDDSPIKKNEKTGEVFVGTSNGLYVFSTEV